MVSSAVSHIIGTIGLLSVLVTTILGTGIFSVYLYQNSAQAQLQDITNYVAAQMVMAASIATQAPGSSTAFVLNLTIPVTVSTGSGTAFWAPFIAGYPYEGASGYNLSIGIDSGTNGLVVNGNLQTYKSVTASSPVTIDNATSRATIFVTVSSPPLSSGKLFPRLVCTENSTGIWIALKGG